MVVATYTSWRAHRTIRLGAGLAYYCLFAVVPLLTISLAVAGLVLDRADLQELVSSVLDDAFDGALADATPYVVTELDLGSVAGGLGAVGLVSLVVAASLIFVALQDAFAVIWEVPVRAGIRHTLLRRALAGLVVLATGVVIVVAFVLQTLSGLLHRFVPDDSQVAQTVADVLTVTGSWVVGGLIIGLVFRYLAGTRVRLRIALAGGVTTALAISVGNQLIGWYVAGYGTSSLVGAAGVLFAVLLWFYGLGQIVLAGAELTRALELADPVPWRGVPAGGGPPDRPDPGAARSAVDDPGVSGDGAEAVAAEGLIGGTPSAADEADGGAATEGAAEP